MAIEYFGNDVVFKRETTLGFLSQCYFKRFILELSQIFEFTNRKSENKIQLILCISVLSNLNDISIYNR